MFFIGINRLQNGAFDHLLDEIKITQTTKNDNKKSIVEKKRVKQNVDHEDDNGEQYSTKLASIMCEANFLPLLLQRKLKYGGIVPTVCLRWVIIIDHFLTISHHKYIFIYIYM